MNVCIEGSNSWSTHSKWQEENKLNKLSNCIILLEISHFIRIKNNKCSSSEYINVVYGQKKVPVEVNICLQANSLTHSFHEIQTLVRILSDKNGMLK